MGAGKAWERTRTEGVEKGWEGSEGWERHEDGKEVEGIGLCGKDQEEMGKDEKGLGGMERDRNG